VGIAFAGDLRRLLVEACRQRRVDEVAEMVVVVRGG
jgi:predicted translin family RNA/ssDNA-binding protein